MQPFGGAPGPRGLRRKSLQRSGNAARRCRPRPSRPAGHAGPRDPGVGPHGNPALQQRSVTESPGEENGLPDRSTARRGSANPRRYPMFPPPAEARAGSRPNPRDLRGGRHSRHGPPLCILSRASGAHRRSAMIVRGRRPARSRRKSAKPIIG